MLLATYDAAPPPVTTREDAAPPTDGPPVPRRTPVKGLGNRTVAGVVTSFIEALGAVLSDKEKEKIAASLLRQTKRRKRKEKGITIGRLCKLYCEHAERYYCKLDTGTTGEATSVELAMRPLRKLFARTRVSDFGPRKLSKVRDAMIELGWCRKHINQQVGRIKRMFKWAVENETIPASSYHSIQAVAGLRAGRSEARESSPVKPVPEPWIEAVLPHTSPQVRAMIQVQLLTGMRPGEVCIMRTCDIDTTQQPWVYRPEHHKTEHHHHERTVFLGPKSQEIVRPFLKPGQPTAYLFSPADADKIRREKLHAARKTPMSCGNRPGTNRKRRPKPESRRPLRHRQLPEGDHLRRRGRLPSSGGVGGRAGEGVAS